MVAAIETNGNQAAFYSLREPAWHGLGFVATEEHTPQEMLELAHLANWNVRAMDLSAMLPPSVDTHLDRKVIVRNNPFHDPADPDSKEYNALGVVGGRYVIGQNEELAAFGEHLGARSETAGSIYNGATVFMSFALERDIVIDPNGVRDPVKTYLMLYTSHDGSSNLVAGVTPTRVVCANTLQVARADMKPVFKIRHSKSMQDRIAAAKRTMELQVKYTEKFAQVAGDLHEVTVTDNEFMDIIKFAFPEPDADAKKAVRTRWDNKVDDLMQLWNGPTQANIANTGWAAFNALTENQQYNRTVYNGNSENFNAAGAGFDDLTNKERSRLLTVVTNKVLV
jgi:phage/plasmid-like protein (TIGR03299 family)